MHVTFEPFGLGSCFLVQMNPYSPKMVPDETNPDQLVRLGQNQAKPDPFLSALLTWRVRNARLHKNTHSLTLSLFEEDT